MTTPIFIDFCLLIPEWENHNFILPHCERDRLAAIFLKQFDLLPIQQIVDEKKTDSLLNRKKGAHVNNSAICVLFTSGDSIYFIIRLQLNYSYI